MLNADNGTYDSCRYWAHPPVYMPLNCKAGGGDTIKRSGRNSCGMQEECSLMKLQHLYQKENWMLRGNRTSVPGDPEYCKTEQEKFSDILPALHVIMHVF